MKRSLTLVTRCMDRGEIPYWIYFTSSLLVLAPIFGTGLVCDDYMYWSAWHRDSWLGIGGISTRPVSSVALVALLGSAENALWVPALLRVAHHAFNAWLASKWVTQWSQPRVGMVAGLCFLFWCSHAEVHWQSSLHDVLATTWVLLALLLSTRCQNWNAPYTIGLVLLCSLAFLTKESSFCLPVLLWLTPSDDNRRSFRQACSAAAVLICFLLLRTWVTGTWWGDVGWTVSRVPNMLELLDSCAKMLFRSFVPGYARAGSLRTVAIAGATILGFTTVAGCALIAKSTRARQHARRLAATPEARMLVCWIAALTPVAHLSVSLQSAENTRYLYLPTVFLTTLFALSWAHVRHWRPSVGKKVLTVTLLFQAVSLHVLGWRWVEATNITQTYEASLTQAVKDRPEIQRWFLVCTPDSYYGAFTARNASEFIVEAAGATGTSAVEILSRTDEAPTLHVPCAYERSSTGTLTVQTPSYQLRLPDLSRSEDWNVTVEGSLRTNMAKAVTVDTSHLRSGDALAVYLGKDLAVVPLSH